MKIFLSFSDQDRSYIEPVAQALITAGHDVFYDRESLEPGCEYNKEIIKEIRSSNKFIFFISPKSIEDHRYSLSELELAKKKWKNPHRSVLPVILENTDEKLIPSYLQSVSYLRPKGNLSAEIINQVDKDLKYIRSKRRIKFFIRILFIIIISTCTFLFTGKLCETIYLSNTKEELLLEAENFHKTKKLMAANYQHQIKDTLLIKSNLGVVYVKISQPNWKTASYTWRYWDFRKKVEVRGKGSLFTESVRTDSTNSMQVSSDDTMEVGPYTVLWSIRNLESCHIYYDSDGMKIFSDSRDINNLKLPESLSRFSIMLQMFQNIYKNIRPLQ